MNFCPKCGNSIGANDKFCPVCGEKLQNDQPGEVEVKPVSSNEPTNIKNPTNIKLVV